MFGMNKKMTDVEQAACVPKVAPSPPPVTYEIVRATNYMLHPYVTLPTCVRVKQDQEHWNPYLFESKHEESLCGLLTKIVQALEQLGMELVVTPAKEAIPQKAEFRKKATDDVPPQSDGRGSN